MSGKGHESTDLRPVDTAKGRWRWVRRAALLAILGMLALYLPKARMQHLLRKGHQSLEQGNFNLALDHFEKAHEADPEGAEAHFWLARTQRKMGNFAAVRQELDAAKRLGYDDAQRLRHEWWLVLAEAGHLNQVESRLPELLQHATETDEVCEAFVTGYCLHLRFDQAMALLDAWQADYPEDFRPHLRRGQIHASLEAWPQARQALQDAVALAPSVGRIRRELATALLHLGKADDAQEQISIALRDDPSDEQALATSAAILRELNQLAAAERQLRRLLALRPNDFAARLALAKVLLADGQAAEAAEQAKRLANDWPNDLETVYTYAQALRALGRQEEATVQFEKYSEMTHVLPKLEQLKNNVNSHPANPHFRYELGRMMLTHVSREEGVAYLQSVLLYDPNHQGAHQALAEYHLQWGDADVAHHHSLRATQPLKDIADLTKPLSGKIP